METSTRRGGGTAVGTIAIGVARPPNGAERPLNPKSTNRFVFACCLKGDGFTWGAGGVMEFWRICLCICFGRPNASIAVTHIDPEFFLFFFCFFSLLFFCFFSLFIPLALPVVYNVGILMEERRTLGYHYNHAAAPPLPPLPPLPTTTTTTTTPPPPLQPPLPLVTFP